MTKGKNVNRLFAMFFAKHAIPAGGGVADGIALCLDQERFRAVVKQAEEETEKAIQAIKSAPDNQWGDDDNAIAGEIMRWIDKF